MMACTLIAGTEIVSARSAWRGERGWSKPAMAPAATGTTAGDLDQLIPLSMVTALR
jgi:hypothetical protein